MAGERRLTSIKALIESLTIKILQPLLTTTTIANNHLNIDNYPSVHALTASQTVILVSNVSITALAANANRKRLFIKNASNAASAPIYIHFGASAATATNGAPIVSGETWVAPEGVIDTREIRVISSTSANKELYIEEWS